MSIDFGKWNSIKNNFRKYEEVKSEIIYDSIEERNPVITVIIPTYKRADYLKQAVESVVKQDFFGGNLNKINMIVVDNCAEIDIKTDEIMREYALKYKNLVYYRNEKNIGLLGNWNRCIELCRTDYFVMLHDDDRLKENYLSRVVEVLNKNPGIDVLCVHRTLINEESNVEKNTFLSNRDKMLLEDEIYEITLTDCINSFMPYLAGAVFKTKACVETGGYDTDFLLNDRFFVAKMVLYHKVDVLPEILYEYRIAVNQGTNDFDKISEIANMSKELVYEMCKFLKYSPLKNKICCTCECIMQARGLRQIYPNINLQEIFKNENIYPIFGNNMKKYYTFIEKLAYFRHNRQRKSMYRRRGKND